MTGFDVVVYGASGFTGRLVAEYLDSTYPDLSWAMAGRSLDKLEAVRSDMGLSPSVKAIKVDSDDAGSIEAMVQAAQVVITTVGPYQFYGEPLVAACAKHGTNYVDLCGEPPFMWQMIETYDALAKRTGAKIVHSTGFDSIPFDMGVYFLQNEAKARFGTPLREVKCRVTQFKGAYSGGTVASGAATMAAAKGDPGVLKRLLSPFALTPGFEGPKQPSGQKPYFDEKLQSWVAPFDMAIINTKNVHRTNFLLGHLYGADFSYEEMIATGSGDKGEAIARKLAVQDATEVTKDLKPGDGPDKETRETGHYELTIVGKSADGAQLSCKVTGDRDPGYGSTCKMMSEAALCLIQDRKDAPGGIYTPAAIYGDAIIDRLRAKAGLSFEVT